MRSAAPYARRITPGEEAENKDDRKKPNSVPLPFCHAAGYLSLYAVELRGTRPMRVLPNAPMIGLLNMLWEVDPQYERALHAWTGIARYLAVAEEQIRRVWSAYDTSTAMEREDVDLIENPGHYDRILVIKNQALADVHFYLNCWRMIARYVFVLADATQFPEIRKLAEAQHAHLEKPKYHLATAPETLGWYADGRDQFEHYDERVPGGRHQLKTRQTQPPAHRLTFGTQVLHPSGTFYQPSFDAAGGLVIGDKRWDVSPASYDRLLMIVQQVDAALRTDAIPVVEEHWEKRRAGGVSS